MPLDPKRLRAWHARQALAAKRRARQESSQTVAKAPLWAQPSHAKVARILMWEGALTSTRELSRLTGAERKFLPRLAAVAASELLKEERQGFQQLLEEVRDGRTKGVLKPHFFAFRRMYDETPQHMWTYHLRAMGEQDGHPSIAKIMAANLGFTMVLGVVQSEGDEEIHIVYGPGVSRCEYG